MQASTKKLLLIMTIVFAAFFAVMPFSKSRALDDEGGIKQIDADNSGKDETASANLEHKTESLCANCGNVFSTGENTCPECGWPVAEFALPCTFTRPDFEITDINTRTVEVVFKGVIILDGGSEEKPDGKYWMLQMQWGNPEKVERIPLGSSFHGYRLCAVEKAKNAGDDENWRLTIEHADGKITTLELNTIVTLQESCLSIKPDKTNGVVGAVTVYEGDTFESKGRIYKVEDIAGQRVLINDIAGFAFIVKISR